MKLTLAAMLGPAACVLVLGVGLALGWGFAATLVASMCGLLAGNLLALVMRKKKDK